MTEKEYFDLQLSSDEKSKNFDFKKLLTEYKKSWKFILASLVCFLALTLLILQFVGTSYKIYSKILLDTDLNNVDATGNVTQNVNPFKSSEIVNNEIEKLTSVKLMRNVLDSLSLQCIYHDGNSLSSKAEIYGSELPFQIIVDTLYEPAYETTLEFSLKKNGFILSEESDDSFFEAEENLEFNFNESIKRPYGVFKVLNKDPNSKNKEFTVQFRNIDELAYNYIKHNLVIQEANKDAAVISIIFEESIPEKGEDIVNKLVEVYGLGNIQKSNIVAANRVNFIDNRLKLLSGELDEVEQSVAAFKAQNAVNNVEFDANSFSQQEMEYRQRLAEYEIELAVLEAIENNLKSSSNETALSSLGLTSSALVGQISDYNRVLLQKESLQRTVPENNPKMIALRNELNLLRGNILNNLLTSKQSLEISIRRIRGRSIEFAQKKQRIPTMEKELVQISREQGIKEKLLLFLLQKREEAAMMIGAARTNFTVIDKAITDYDSASPNKKLVFLFAFVLGLLFPMGVIFIKYFINTKVLDADDIAKTTNVELVGKIPSLNGNIVEAGKTNGPIIEAFKKIKRQLDLGIPEKKSKVLLITSFNKDEGKTFFATNMGAVLSDLNKKTVILYLDKSALPNTVFKQNGNVKLSNYLKSRKRSIDGLLIPSDRNVNLFAISYGDLGDDVEKVFESKKMSDLISELQQKFDYVLFDLPAIENLGLTTKFNAHSDYCIFMVRTNVTERKDLDKIEDYAVKEKIKNPRIVLTGSEAI